MKLKYHTKPISQFTQIDRYLLIPKKMADDFPEGEISLNINGKKISTRVYDIFCDCRPEKHTHKIIDLRDCKNLDLDEGREVEVS